LCEHGGPKSRSRQIMPDKSEVMVRLPHYPSGPEVRAVVFSENQRLTKDSEVTVSSPHFSSGTSLSLWLSIFENENNA
ncbi:hypothetical protein QUF72_22850, partial [Desulfobacterales bacterium HSG2]|nr:hypothetical protein [Desulfobacterales bacterium HSG2]